MSAAENSNDSTTQPNPAPVRVEPTVNDVDPISDASVSPNSIEGLFLRALRLETPAERDVLIRDACGNDLERIQRVTALLRAYEDAGSFLETPVGGLRATQESSLSFLLPSDKEGVLGTIGPYEVLDEIGRGGMGVVMRAVDPKLNRVVAVKALLPELAANPNSRRRFLREAQAAAAISHPHVVAIHAVDDAHQDVAGKHVPAVPRHGMRHRPVVATEAGPSRSAATGGDSANQSANRRRTGGRAQARGHSSRHQAGQHPA